MDARVNTPEIWKSLMPWPKPEQHKHDRGHTLVLGGPMPKAGAAKLAANAALRVGSGLVTIVCTGTDMFVYAATALSLMTETEDAWLRMMEEEHYNTVVIGPGIGANERARFMTLSALQAKKRAVLDADALTVFAKHPEELFKAIQSPVILTPHEGEFARLFPDIVGAREDRALEASARSKAVVILKGHHTVIASPKGEMVINKNAPADLATAGSGDVLSGLCAGLLAQGMEPFAAACAGVWLHSEAARLHGAGLISEDIITLLPKALQQLKSNT